MVRVGSDSAASLAVDGTGPYIKFIVLFAAVYLDSGIQLPGAQSEYSHLCGGQSGTGAEHYNRRIQYQFGLRAATEFRQGACGGIICGHIYIGPSTGGGCPGPIVLRGPSALD